MKGRTSFFNESEVKAAASRLALIHAENLKNFYNGAEIFIQFLLHEKIQQKKWTPDKLVFNGIGIYMDDVCTVRFPNKEQISAFIKEHEKEGTMCYEKLAVEVEAPLILYLAELRELSPHEKWSEPAILLAKSYSFLHSTVISFGSQKNHQTLHDLMVVFMSDFRIEQTSEKADFKNSTSNYSRR